MTTRPIVEHGDSFEVTIGVSFQLDERARVVLVEATAALSIRMPDATTLHRGHGQHVVVSAAASTGAIAIRDDGNNFIVLSDGTSTLAAGTGVRMFLLDNSTSNGVWVGKKYSANFAPNPTPVELAHVIGGSATAATRVQQYDHQLDSMTLMTGVKGSDISQGGAFQINGTTAVAFGDNVSPFDQVDEFTPSTDSWAALTNSPRDYQQGQCGALGSTAFGYIAGNVHDHNATEEYSRTGDSWTAKLDKPFDCFFGCGVMDDDSDLFVANGVETATDEKTQFERYTPSTNTWASMRPQPSPAVNDHSIGHAEDKGSGKIIRVGGFGSVREEDVDMYDIPLDAWVVRGDFPSPTSPSAREEVGLCGPEDLIHLFGGQGPATQVNNTTHRYSFALDSWTQKANLSIATSLIAQQAVSVQP